MKVTIDINCDLGEGSTRQDADNDALLMPYLSSCNIACGGHAGNLETIEYAIINAIQNQLKIGAHPGYSDPDNFGRRTLSLTETEILECLQQQLEMFLKVVNKMNAELHHIKLHGALYNDVELNSDLADVIANYLSQSFPKIKVFGLAQGTFQKACEDKKLDFIPEGFMDRRYSSDFTLAPRTTPKAIINETDLCIEQALALAKNQSIKSVTGDFISPAVKTICLHGDNEDALSIAKQLHETLLANNILVA